MDFIALMNKAWRIKNEIGYERVQVEFKNLLSNSYVRIAEACANKLIGNREVAFNVIYKALEIVIIGIMKNDIDLLQGEYDAYIKFADSCNKKHYNSNEIRNMSLTTDQISKAINVLTNYRYSISNEVYEGMVLAFCYLALLGDTAFDENEYYIIRCFFNSSLDYCPSDWETFKREW